MKIPDIKTSDFIMDALSKLSEKNRYYILGAILIAMILVNYFLPMRWMLKRFSEINPKASTLLKNLHQAKRDIRSQEKYRMQVAQLREQMKKAGSQILSKDEIPTILEEITMLAQQSRIKVNQIMPLKEYQKLAFTNDEGKFLSLPISLNLRGGYHDIGRFLNRMEKDKIFMSVTDFEIAASGDDPIRHTVSMTVKTFIRDPDKDVVPEKKIEKGKKKN